MIQVKITSILVPWRETSLLFGACAQVTAIVELGWGWGWGDPPDSRVSVSKKAGEVQVPWVWVFFPSTFVKEKLWMKGSFYCDTLWDLWSCADTH